MRDQVTPEQVSEYQENGFLVVEGFLDDAEVAHWSQTTDEAVAQRLEQSRDPAKSGFAGGLNNQGNPDDYYAQVFTQCLKLADSHAGMHELMHDPRLGRVAATLASVDGIRIWHDQALYKPPFGNPTGWHLDNPFWSFTSRNSLSIWVALDDATRDNGCLYYLPGTQKTATWENAGIGRNQADLFKLYPEWRTIESVGCPCPAGSAVFHNGVCAHGAGANMTNRPRRAMTCAYMPDGEAFNGTQNVLPSEYVQTLKVGDLLNDDTINPLIWHV